VQIWRVLRGSVRVVVNRLELLCRALGGWYLDSLHSLVRCGAVQSKAEQSRVNYDCTHTE
jgi:hypothetical protein